VRRSVLARLFLVVALLAGWQAALVHPLEHVDAHGHLVHAGHAHHHDAHGDEGEGAPSDPFDKLCDALGALTALASHDAFGFFLDTPANAVAERFIDVPRPADPVPFLSQGPPTFL
jgi:hypothetical protein